MLHFSDSTGDLFDQPDLPAQTTASEPLVSDTFGREIELRRIRLPQQLMRRVVDGAALLQLTESIRIDGLLHPLVVLPLSDGDVMLVAGYRRYLACEALGWSKVPVVWRSDLEPEGDTQFRITLAENENRVDPCAYDWAGYVCHLHEQRVRSGIESRIQDLAEDLRSLRAPYHSVGWISQMLLIGTNIQGDILELAGVELADLSILSRTALHRVAKLPKDERPAALRGVVATQHESGEENDEHRATTGGPAFRCVLHRNGAETLMIDPRRMTIEDCDRLTAKVRDIRRQVEERSVGVAESAI